MDSTNKHILFLLEALTLAKTRRGYCAPNPSVGAIVTKNNKIISKGVHIAHGKDHAEVDALKHLSDEEKNNATLYVTLEPCCHTGKTPPCVDLIIKSNIKEVFYTFKDPNPIVAGKGELALREAGIKCQQIELPEINLFYRSYAYWWQHKKPWVTAKLAISLDGKIAMQNNKPIDISGPELKTFTFDQRRSSDAILTTSTTIISDNPQLNVRDDKNVESKKLYILDRNLKLTPKLNIFKNTDLIYVFHSHKHSPTKQSFPNNVFFIPIAEKIDGLDLEDMLGIIGEHGIHDLWVEAGGTLFTSMFKQDFIHRCVIYISPKFLGNNATPGFSKLHTAFQQANKVNWTQHGNDAICDFTLTS